MIIFFSFKISYSKKFIQGNILFIYAIRAEQKIAEIAFFSRTIDLTHFYDLKMK